MGSFVLRGDAIALVGALDKQAEAEIPWEQMPLCSPIHPIHH